MNNNLVSRRTIVKGSFLGLLAASVPCSLYATPNVVAPNPSPLLSQPGGSYPHIEPELVMEVVGASHFNFARVKELVDKRPELAKATWDWRYGDFESAIGASSHVGHRDLAKYLVSKGARPTIFTFAMMGAYDVVKAMIEFNPGIQRTTGPHGISLLRHAQAGDRMKESMTQKEKDNLKRLQDYLEELGDADGEKYIDVSPEEQKKYLGDYKYGDGEKDGFSIQLNMQKLLSLGPIGDFGGSIYKIAEHQFTYNGAPSVTISFNAEEGQIMSLTVTDPDRSITARKVH